MTAAVLGPQAKLLRNDADLGSDDHGAIPFTAFIESTARAMVAASDGKEFVTGAARANALGTNIHQKHDQLRENAVDMKECLLENIET